MPKFCKVDVEGYESEVFLGLDRPIAYICFEFNKPLVEDTAKCLHILSQIGRYECNYLQYERMNLVLPQWRPIKAFADALKETIGPQILTGEIIVRLA